MDTNDYKPNSHKFREDQQQKPAVQEEKRRVERVVKGPAKVKKKNGIYKFADVFISEDVGNVKDYIITDIVVPTVKKAILGAIDMILNGGSGSYGRRSSESNVSYRKYYDEPRDNRRYANTSEKRSRFDHDDIVFETRGDADAALDEMSNVIERYGFVTVADMYDMAHLSQPYTSNRYGWTDIRSAEIVRLLGGGYVIKMPKASPIDR